MAFDDDTRKRLRDLVTECRGLLTDEFRIQVQQTYGLDPTSGEVTPLERLTHLTAAERQTAELLRQTLAHYLASEGLQDRADDRIPVIDRIVREQAFTVLNRLAALLMMEARGVLLPAVSQGQQSKAFELYKYAAGTALGEAGDAYRVFLFSLFDEFAQDLPALFDRFAPQGRLFPREAALLLVLAALNHHEIQPLWVQDETIGWMYQYFNPTDERKAMREARAPRNSRELAVRNQFFTPRYVVEFLVDNTLGRLWLNSTSGQTGLRGRCQNLLTRPDEHLQPALKLRDPRTIKLLDPACGSMHFGLYAFDLFLQIYEEAWDWEQAHGPGSLDVSAQSDANLQPLVHEYADRDVFLRDVPRLIIDHNIHGVDIDPRAAQIASLALWLRSQRAWHERGVKAQYRPVVGRGHVVAAVAPPAEKELRVQIEASLTPLDAQLFGKTLQMLKGLPELGVLLKVEQELPRLIQQVYVRMGAGLFAEEEKEDWTRAEMRLRSALETFATAGKATYQGRLFAQDALEGLRLIDLCRQTFDVVVMNPPFGQPSPYAQQYLKEAGSDGWKDIYAGFFEASIRLTRSRGMIGAITSSQYFHTRQMAGLREKLLKERRLRVIVDLGADVLDGAAVQTALAVLSGPMEKGSILYNDLFDAEDKEASMKLGIVEGGLQEIMVDDISAIPGRPLCLHATPAILRQWRMDAVLDPNTAFVATGNHTFDDERFVRLSHEVIDDSRDWWVSFEKGGEYQPFLSPSELFLQWKKDGAELKALNVAAYGSDAQVMQSSKHWGKGGICYTHVSSVGFSPRILPRGTIFSSESISIFLKNFDGDGEKEYLTLLGFLVSTAAQELVHVFGRYRKIENRAVSGMPISFARLSAYAETFEDFARQGISICHDVVSLNEVSAFFILPDAIVDRSFSGEFRNKLLSKIEFLYGEIDRLADACLGIDETDLSATRRQKLASKFVLHRDARNENERQSDLWMWTVGVAFGRFDWRVATGERADLPNLNPFDPLPAKSPGMLPDGSTPFHDHAGILVDDPSHPHDLVRLMECVLERVDMPVPDQLRRWLQRDFFAFHLQRYSSSNRRAPIYWPLSTASGSYTLWIYYPSLSSQTLYTAVNDFIDGPDGKLARVAVELVHLRGLGSARTREDERRLEALVTLETELKDMRDTLLRIAPAYQPHHDDGVQITAAPLWPLFRHKPWQNLLKDTWAKLEQGDYDWALLAMAYWPERVRQKCRTDKSLAIAHNLEHLYVEPPAAAKKTRGRKATAG